MTARSCRACRNNRRSTAWRAFAALAVLCSTLAVACDSDHQHLTTSSAKLRLQGRQPQETADQGLTVAGAIPSDVSIPPADSSTVSAGLPVGNVTPLPAGYTMPEPFDAILGVNFTSSSCPAFFTTFLDDPDFKACHPLASLLETSSSFFKAMQSPTVLPAVLDQICSTDQSTCSGVMDGYAEDIQKKSNCGDDLALGNALAVAALNSFQNFKLYREVGCLKDERTQAYCFAEAANATTASDLYLYYLPGGTSLPSGTQPTCDGCSQQVVQAYSTYATNSTLRLAQTYSNARNVISLRCGPSFAPMVAATTTKTSDAARTHTGIVVSALLLECSLALLF